MKAITTYAPPTFMKPTVVFSTLAHETAICFVEALHGDHALHIILGGTDKSPSIKKSDWVVIKKHRTPSDAANFHRELLMTYRNGESERLWQKGWEPYLKLYDKYCPEEMKDPIEKS